MSELPKALTYVELDAPYCANTYGVAPCTASVPTTGAAKCFNCPKTCQDPDNYVEVGTTYRFAMATEYLPHEIEAIPSITAIDFTPAIISLGKDLGQRATLEISFVDHPDTDTGAGFDKYLADRGYWPYERGTFFGRFRARQPYLQGRTVRWIQGYLGQALADMETRHYKVDSFDGPDATGIYKLMAADTLKLADGDQAQAPKPNTGFLSADIDAVQTTAALLPTGIGNAEYPAGGHICIGGNEICLFARTGDSLTLSRGTLGSVASAHKAQDRVQLVLVYTGATAAFITDDLFVTYTAIPSSTIDLPAWEAEAAAFLGNVYTTAIPEPTPVNTLVAELIEQAALSIWEDDLTQQLRFKVLRPILTDAFTFTPDHRVAGSFVPKDQPDTRISRVLTRFGQIDPTKPLSNLDNFRSSSLVVDDEAEAAYGVQALKEINSRWIPSSGRTVADRLGAIIVGRFRDPPRHFTYDVMRYNGTDVMLGAGYQLQGPFLQDESGAAVSVPIQVTQLNPSADRFTADAEEMLFNAPPLTPGTDEVVFDANNFNVNLQTAHDSIYPAAVSGDICNFTINAGVVIGSHSSASPAVIVGTFAAGVIVNLIVNGHIQGKGGAGGAGSMPGPVAAVAGEAGSIALYTRQAINLTNGSGQILGGGGGGGGAAAITGGPGGGGGAGTDAGAAGASVTVPGGAGTPTAGGASGTSGGATSGAGGGPGVAGGNGTGVGAASGGAAGAAIDGVSHITFSGSHGTITGSQIN